MKAPVNITVCLALIRSELAGYREYPNTEAGETRFARALQEVAVSVAHASAILQEFRGEFPTVQQISDTGINLLPKFEVQHNQLLEWEREYGKPAPAAADFRPAHLEPPYMERDRRIKAYLTLKHGGAFPGFHKISWREVFEAQEQCGYPLTSEQAKMIGR